MGIGTTRAPSGSAKDAKTNLPKSGDLAAGSWGTRAGVRNPTRVSVFGPWVGHPMMPMREDRERRELQRLRDEFLEIMRRENEAVLFDEEAQRRIGQSIGRSLRQGRSDYSDPLANSLRWRKERRHRSTIADHRNLRLPLH